ncbi:hypothetical protein [Olleya sp. ITB9]|uniref:hypothetical protein n=1 Tax=Olleya sp. ITB9 TaxID=1715648 RepID=UPI0006D12757|nr:hypothetical protein [Olleya sp. ITB9]
MKIKVITFCLTVLLISCFKAKKGTNSELKKETENLVSSEVTNKSIAKQEYFTNTEEFKKFINTKWISIEGDVSCSESRTIEISGGYLLEYDGMEPSKCKIESIKKVNSKKLEIKIEENCNYGNTFNIEIIDFNSKLVKWSFYNGISYNAKPFKNTCNDKKVINLYEYPNGFISPTSNWLGEYYFENRDIGKQIFITDKNIRYKSVARQHYDEYELISNQVADTLALYYYKGVSHTDEFLKDYLPLIKIYKKGSKYYVNTSLTTPENIKIEIQKLK